jgi:hypothetical protein
MFNEPFPFAERVRQLHSQLALLKKLQIPSALTWRVDWRLVMLNDVDVAKARLNTKHHFFSAIREKNKQPAIYTFAIRPEFQQVIFDGYHQLKKVSANLRKAGGVGHPEFFNIAHVPRQSTASSFLYVGSRKEGVLSRLQQHLGLTGSGRTGALYLRQLIPLLPKPPAMEISVFFFDRRYAHLTEQIEYVFQQKLDPILGRRSAPDLAPMTQN